MPSSKRNNKGLHPRNIHNQHYDFPLLAKSYPALASYVKPSAHGNLSIEYSDPLAVKALNTALLRVHYNINWDIPKGALCPPIPGRVDYIHYIAELLGIDEPTSNSTKVHTKSKHHIRLLDIGTGANGIYSLLASQIYGWNSVGTDINTQSLENVTSVIANNPQLKDLLTLRKQQNKNNIFEGIIKTDELFDVSVCNPPFHASLEEARKSNLQKRNNLARSRGDNANAQSNTNSADLNFGGAAAELWCKGGERMFLKKLIKESQIFSTQCRWFTSLVSKAENIKTVKKLLRKLNPTDVREIEMTQGNKVTRILAWTFM